MTSVPTSRRALLRACARLSAVSALAAIGALPLAASASSNEAGYITHKVVRSLGMLAFDNQARV